MTLPLWLFALVWCATFLAWRVAFRRRDLWRISAPSSTRFIGIQFTGSGEHEVSVVDAETGAPIVNGCRLVRGPRAWAPFAATLCAFLADLVATVLA